MARDFAGKVTLLTMLLVLQLSGCATIPEDEPVPHDPYESTNRAMFKFNSGLDKYLLKPVAKGYHWVLPDFAETGVSNFFSNLDDVSNAFNNLLQGKFKAAGSDSLRFVMNSTLGVGGLFDVASKSGLTKHNEDFGQTLGVWGVPSGPYLILPLLGPSTLRDSNALLVDYATSPISYVSEAEVRWGLRALNIVDARSNLLGIEELSGQGLYDDYERMRDLYLDRREYLVSDGKGSGNSDDDLRNELEALDGDSKPSGSWDDELRNELEALDKP